MSAREQAKRDAEFDRLLLGEGLIDDWGHFTEAGMRAAYEMGKRHESENAPRWHDAPTCPGLWLNGEYGTLYEFTGDPSSEMARFAKFGRWYGPIPADEVKA